MNVGGLITIFFVIVAIVWGFWLIFKRDLMSINLGKLMSYFAGVIITLIIVLWITSQFLPWWAIRLVENTRNSENVQALEQVGQDLWNEATNSTPVFTAPNPAATARAPQPSEPTVSPVANPESGALGARPGQTIHIVVKGDTLYGLQRRYGVTVKEIMAANGLTNETIFIGQRLTIP